VKPHECDESCVCPEHGTPLLWSAATAEHACQEPSCRYAHGMEAQLLREYFLRMTTNSMFGGTS
jgi:hypothetical protein